MPFFLDGNPTQSEVSEAVNYLLSNFTTGLSSDVNTGQITASGGVVVGYIYQYLAVKYADSFDGSVNFSDSPTNREYYGLRNSNSAAESSSPTDYIWSKVTGGFGTTKFLWYQTTGGRAIQLQVATSAPDAGWYQDSGASIDLDTITSATIPVIAESFVSYFTPPVMQVPRTGAPLAPVFTNVNAAMFATDKGVVIPFTDAQTDSNVAFVNNSWRIGNSATTGFGDISYTNITVGNPTDSGDFALWPTPTAMSASPAYITVPVRYKDSLGTVTQASVAKVQFTFADPGQTGPVGSSIDISGYTSFVQNAGGAYTPTNATLSALLSNVTSPTYSWVISGATPTTATTASVVVTPTSSSTGVTVTLTVNGSNLTSPISKTLSMPVVYDGAPGTAGSNGVMSAFPTIYIWTGSSTPPTRPTTTSTYTWATGAYTAPSGWSTTAPSNTTPGNYLWSITVPLNASATTTTSTLDWTNVTYPIRGIAYNGTNGTNGAAASLLTLSSTAQTFTFDGSGTASPASQSINFTANLQNLTGIATFTATKYNSSNVNIGSATLTGTGNTRSLSVADFDVAEYVVVTASLSGFSDTTSVVRLQDGANGTNGTSPIVGLLTNESVTVAANSSGVVSDFSSAGGTFKVYQGTTDVTTSATFSVASSSGVTISINASTGVYSVSAMSGLQGTATLQAVYGGVTIQKIYSISKSLAGQPGSNGTNGAPGSATFVITRVANDSSAPTNTEVNALLGRNPVAGDICTVSYNNYNNAVVYRYVTSWTLFTTYITGSLIVENTITGDKVAANTITGTNIAASTITADKLSASYIQVGHAASDVNSGVTTIDGGKITASSITANQMAANSITASNAAIANAAVNTLQIAGNAVIVPSASTGSGSGGCSVTLSLDEGNTVYVSGYIGSASGVNGDRTSVLKVGSTTLASLTIQSVFDTAGYADFFPTNLSVNYTIPSTGSYTFSISYSGSGVTGTAASSIQVLGIKR